jgi:hypothetical protein
MSDPLLSRQQVVALARETDDAAGTFSHGLALLRRLHTSARDSAAMFALLSTGAEKLLKLTVGITHLEQTNEWPSREFMQTKMRHRIVLLDQHAGTALRDGISLSIVPGHMKSAMERVSADPLIGPMLRALDRYATQGRFFNLDTLANSPQREPSPSELWEEVLSEVFRSDPDALGIFAQVATDPEGRRRMNDAIADSLELWWQVYQRAWTTGILGSRGKVWASTLDLFDTDADTGRPLKKRD